MYLAMNKKKSGLIIKEEEKTFFVFWSDLDKLKEGKIEYGEQKKPIIVLKSLEQQDRKQTNETEPDVLGEE